MPKWEMPKWEMPNWEVTVSSYFDRNLTTTFSHETVRYWQF
jgi:hypothetical protein